MINFYLNDLSDDYGYELSDDMKHQFESDKQIILKSMSKNNSIDIKNN
jgi:hypothetical protein